MADRDDQPPDPPGSKAVGLSPDEADRISEKFQPSWDPSSEKTPVTTPALAEPRKPAKHTLIGGISPFAAAPEPEPAKAETTTRESSRPKQQTLVGIAPSSDPPPLPSKPTGSSPVTAGGTADGPSGIAKLYKPKDDPAAPPVVLTEDVQRAEAATTAELEARRRALSSRSMQTVMNIKAPDFPGPKPTPNRRSGLWQLLVGVAAGVLVVAAVFKLTAKDPTPAEPSALSPDSPAAGEPRAAKTEPAPAAAAPAAADGPAVTPVEDGQARPVVLPAETASGDSVEPAVERNQPAPRRTSTKAAAAAAPKKAAPKPSKSSAKETPSSPPAGKGGVIVRDTPF